MVGRAELRRRWQGVAVLTLLVVIVGAVVLATAAGARRSSTALSRFNRYSRASDLELDVDPATTPAQVAAFTHASGVASVATLHAYALQVDGRPDQQIAAALDDRLGTAVDRARLIAGRRQNPREPNEITISEGLGDLGVGSHLRAASMTPEQLQTIIAGNDPGPSRGPDVVLDVVGIVRRPLDLGDRAATGGVVVLSPAFAHEYDGQIGIFATVLRVRTVHGRSDIARVTATARTMFGASSSFQVTDLARENGGADGAINVVTLALWIFAGVTALAGAIAIVIMLTREIAQASTDLPTLQSLGMTRGSRVAIGMIPAFVAAGVGTVLAAVVAVAASPLLPVGIARRADPNPGFHADWLVLAVGIAGVGAFVLVVGMVASMRASRARSVDPRLSMLRSTRVVEWLGRVGFSPAFTSGVRMTFDRRSSGRTLPTRSAFLGAIFGVASLSAVVVLSGSLGHLASTPRLYGWTFDFRAPDNTFAPACGTTHDRGDYGLHTVPGVAAVAAVCFAPIRVGGRTVTGWGLTPVRGDIEPEIVSGRAPRGPREIALGQETLSALHTRIGDSVRVRAPGSDRRYRIVGRAVFPRITGQDLQPLADGAFFSGDAFRPLAAHSDDVSRYLLGRFAAGSDHRTVLTRVSRTAAFNARDGQTALVSDQGAASPSVPPEIERLEHVGWFAPALAGLLALLASLAVGHALVTGVRRRRHEFAVLKTVGFSRRQVRAAVAWHATMLAAVGLLVGIPLGLIVGRWAWRILAHGLGVSTTPWFPALELVLVAVISVAIVNLIGAFPARTAARTRPAVALRAE
jgi:ABC-type lipoprotein release transport system permease subunit